MKNEPHSLVVILGDMHNGYRAAYTLEEVSNKLVSYIINRKVTSKTKEVVLVFPGDLNEGMNVWEGQNFEIRQQRACESARNLALRIYKSLYKPLYKHFSNLTNKNRPKIRFCIVSGNHGHIAKYGISLDEETAVALARKVPRVEHSCKEWMNVLIQNVPVHIRHNAVKHLGTPAMQRKIYSWSRQYQTDIVIHAHYHQAGIDQLDNIWAIRSASWKKEDSLAERNAWFAPNRLWMFKIFKDDSKPREFDYIELEELCQDQMN